MSDKKGRAVVLMFYIGSFLYKRNSIFYLPYKAFYKLIVEPYFSLEIPLETDIGKDLKIYHGFGIVINRKTVIGNNVTLRHGVTIGNTGDSEHCPIIGDNVEFGCNACIFGSVEIKSGSFIRAGSIISDNKCKNKGKS